MLEEYFFDDQHNIQMVIKLPFFQTTDAGQDLFFLSLEETMYSDTP